MAVIKVKDGNGNWNVVPITSEINNYSTAEQVIGTWIDGKPLYRVTKTVSVTNAEGGANVFNLANAIPVNVYGIGGNGSDPYSNERNILGGYLNSTWYSGFYVTSTNNVVFYGSTQFNNGKIVVTVEYTKTTD